MRKLSIYVETSVWSHAFADDAPQLRAATEQFLADAREGRYELFVSEVVMDGVANASADLAERLSKLILGLTPGFLDFDDDAAALTREYLAPRRSSGGEG